MRCPGPPSAAAGHAMPSTKSAWTLPDFMSASRARQLRRVSAFARADLRHAKPLFAVSAIGAAHAAGGRRSRAPKGARVAGESGRINRGERSIVLGDENRRELFVGEDMVDEGRHTRASRSFRFFGDAGADEDDAGR